MCVTEVDKTTRMNVTGKVVSETKYMSIGRTGMVNGFA